jgi:uncharacterized protein
MDAFKTHGAFSWSELLTTDPAAATAFYGKLFGWATETMDMGSTGPYHVVRVGDTSIGGITGMPPQAGPMPPNWGCYVTVEAVDKTAELCVELGGKVLMGPFDIPTVGRMAVLQDPQGAVINVITYVPQ